MYCFFFSFSFKNILDKIIVTILYEATKGDVMLANPEPSA
jgi:hypothetical protein